MARRRWDHPGQLEFVFEFACVRITLMELTEDEDQDWWSAQAPRHTWVPATARKPPKITAPRSIFEAAAFEPKAVRMRGAQCEAPRARKVVEIADGVHRHIALLPQETDEWAERERARRARQVPPKAPKGARTKGRKLIELVGSD